MFSRHMLLLLLSLSSTSGCSWFRGNRGGRVDFQPVVVSADLELEKLNDEELFAEGSAAFAAEDFRQAARFFGRIADFHPQSRHRRAALYNAGLAHQRIDQWEEASFRFAALANPEKDPEDSLDASFRLAECLYHLDRYDEAIAILSTLARRRELGINKRLEAMVQQGICELETGKHQAAESTLRKALGTYYRTEDKERIDEYFPSQAQFFLGEIYRLYFEAVTLDPEKGVEELAKDLDYKSELLLSAQGHYLRAIRMGHGYWATASGTQIGSLYEILYEHMVNAPAPRELDAEQALIYREEIRKKIRILLGKAITIYERTLEAAERIGAQNPFVDRSRESLRKMKQRLVEDSALDDEMPAVPTTPAGS